VSAERLVAQRRAKEFGREKLSEKRVVKPIEWYDEDREGGDQPEVTKKSQ